MRAIFPILSACVLSGLLSPQAALGFPKVGDELPDVTAFDEAGNPFPLKESLAGKHSVMVFGCLT